MAEARGTSDISQHFTGIVASPNMLVNRHPLEHLAISYLNFFLFQGGFFKKPDARQDFSAAMSSKDSLSMSEDAEEPAPTSE